MFPDGLIEESHPCSGSNCQDDSDKGLSIVRRSRHEPDYHQGEQKDKEKNHRHARTLVSRSNLTLSALHAHGNYSVEDQDKRVKQTLTNDSSPHGFNETARASHRAMPASSTALLETTADVQEAVALPVFALGISNLRTLFNVVTGCSTCALGSTPAFPSIRSPLCNPQLLLTLQVPFG